ncbi:hypothetical protein FQA39_LY06751 [Lamprigera yunnana]|nr:hypothetical protein FQA39_LY06751 [Lamprigera yunnana]
MFLKTITKHFDISVVDIYSDWCGPCLAMLNNLKKFKLEVGGDNLHIVQAKSDEITNLVRFRGKSEPTWMFISKGKMVKLLFGANSPQLMQILEVELKKELQAKDGLIERTGVEITALSPEEQEEFNIKCAEEEEARQIEAERKRQELFDWRIAVADVILETVPKNGIVVVFPQAKDMVKSTLAELWEPARLSINLTERPLFTESMIEEMLYFAENKFSEMDMIDLLSGPCIAYFLKTSNDFEGDIDELVRHFIYGEMMEPPGSPESPAQLLMGYVTIAKSPTPGSTTNVDTAASTDSLPKIDVKSLSSLIVHSKSLLENTMKLSVDEKKEEKGETYEITGIWAPPNNLVRATAIKLLFPKIYDPVALQEPIPEPPHIAIAFDAAKRREIFNLVEQYEDYVMHYGFFTDDQAEKAQLIAKSLNQFSRYTEFDPTIRLVIQLSKKKSEALCAFAQMNPTYISHNTVIGEQECKIFFPEGYEEPVEEVGGEVIEPKKKKGKGKKAKTQALVTSVVSETEEEKKDHEEEDDEEEGEGEDEEGGEEEIEGEAVDEADKATSTIPE